MKNITMDRRHFISRTSKAIGAGTLVSATSLWSSFTQAQGLQTLGEVEPFDLGILKARAKKMAMSAYVPNTPDVPASVANLGWEEYHSLRHKDEKALWIGDKPAVSAKFFHLGWLFKKPVHMYQVIHGKAQEIAYDPGIFDYAQSGLNAAKLPRNLGFAGFKILDTQDLTRDVVAFLGASYFRAVGAEKQFGLSARGLAVDTGMPYAEEFPEFIAFWLVKPAPKSKTLTIYTLLDSPSVSGAYQFDITLGDTLTMDVTACLYPRKEIARMGIGPCTSMFQHGENDKRMAWDWRPEIHDSDGLQMHTGSGEWIWRPLRNPAHLQFSAFQDNNPRGFGLVQRDRSFDHYQDDGVYYDKRPSLWVEPQGPWGSGAVDLVEIPTHDETFDNIVAFWVPAQKPQAGEEHIYAYRLHWGALPPVQMPLAHCVDSRTGLGGVVGQKRTYYSQRFTIDFQGDVFKDLPADAKVNAVVTASKGGVELVSARPLKETGGYRAMFDLRPDATTEQIDLRLYLEHDGKALTETWLYPWSPPPVDQRTLY